MLNLFICFGCVIGTTLNTRTDFSYIDIPEHIFAGYLACMGAFFLGDIMQGETHKLKISLSAMFAFTGAITVLVGWEVYEFVMDRMYGFVMQHGQMPYSEGLTDTMADILLGAGGALFAMFMESFTRAGLIGKNKAEVRVKVKANRAEFKALKQQAYDNGEAFLG